MTQAIQQASWRDYYQLTKPKVVALMMVTTLVGMALASPGWIPLNALILGNIGIALCAGSAACVNHLVDEEIDQRMARTQGRPCRGPCSGAKCRDLCRRNGRSGCRYFGLWR